MKLKSLSFPAAVAEARTVVLTILLLSFVDSARANLVTVNLGPSHTVTSQTPPSSFQALNGTPLDGRTVSIDFSFLNNEFVRIFDVTSNTFEVSISLRTNCLTFPGYLGGTGYLIDIDGNAIPGFGITGSASGDNGWMGIGLYALLKDDDGTPNTDLLRPFDFYGVHYDLIFPDIDDPSMHVTGGQFSLLSDTDGVFGIGPGVPRNIVPDSGSTLLLLGMSAATAIGLRTWRA